MKFKKKRKMRFLVLCFCLIIVAVKGFQMIPNWVNNISMEYQISKIDENEITDSTLQRLLENYSKKDILPIIQNRKAYPQELLELLIRNEETLKFVIDYPEKENTSFQGKLKESLNEIPLLLQWDQRWGYQSYGDGIIALNGCAPTTLSMVLSYIKQDASITPSSLSVIAQNNGYYVNGVGTSWIFFEKTAEIYDVKCEMISMTPTNVFNALNQNIPLILSMEPGDFTTSGHFILAYGLDQDGNIKIKDCNSKKNSDKVWNINTILQQCRSIWKFTL